MAETIRDEIDRMQKEIIVLEKEHNRIHAFCNQLYGYMIALNHRE